MFDLESEDVCVRCGTEFEKLVVGLVLLHRYLGFWNLWGRMMDG